MEINFSSFGIPEDVVSKVLQAEKELENQFLKVDQ